MIETLTKEERSRIFRGVGRGKDNDKALRIIDAREEQVAHMSANIAALKHDHAAERAALVERAERAEKDAEEWRDVSRDWRYRAETAERDLKDARGGRSVAERALAEARAECERLRARIDGALSCLSGPHGRVREWAAIGPDMVSELKGVSHDTSRV